MTDEQSNLAKFIGSAAAVSAAVAALTAFGFRVSNPAEQLSEYAAKHAQVTQRIEYQINAQGRRIDSLSYVIDRVDALVQVKCIETTNKLVRQMLTCPR